MTAEHMAQARGFFERALALDPGNMEALVGMAAVDVTSGAFFIVSDRDARFAAAEATLIKALSMSPQHARAHMFLGAVQI
jgi:cytochrome c-type biogenesis protein CcmH/NrfG